ncbi:MAG: cobaltochelatase subunit CobN, partial [Alphaproteobacteria bacterium]|nr:cobaltochelatase subunit CobN [Alphaproteobacteria bacterium]
LRGLAGRRVAPGPSGAPTRGRPDVLPTGRNFYSVDTRAVPTPASWALGWAAAEALLERHLQEHGDHLRVAALTAWGTSNMRTGGDDVAQALALMGVRPTWDEASRRVTGFEILPLTLLGRPRVDVTLRVSGLFRDAFANLIELVDRAVRDVAALDEPADMNPLASRARVEGDAARVFGPKPGAYGAGLQALIDEGGWTRRADLGEAYVAWSGWAYASGEGRAARGELETRLSKVEAVLQNQDNREHDILDSDDYYQFQGGLSAAVERATSRAPRVYHVDTSLPERPRVLTLAEEIAAVVRSRATNPKWIEGCKRHGYKGAFEIAATVDYLFAYAATTDAVHHHHFDALYRAYLEDDSTRAFLASANPAALHEIATRLLEAQDRGMWHPRSNGTYAFLKRIAGGAVAVGTAEDAAGGGGRGDGGERDRGDRDRGGDTRASRTGARDA